jgi:hypothetical protein
MAADVAIHVYTDDGAGSPVDGGVAATISFLSIDSALTGLANEQDYPVVVGTRSYEKWVAAVVGATAPDNWLNDFQLWGDGAVMAGTSLLYGFEDTWEAPTDAGSIIAVNDFTSRTASSKGNWHTRAMGDANLVNTGDATKYLVFQLVVASTHAGNQEWTDETIYYSYAEA